MGDQKSTVVVVTHMEHPRGLHFEVAAELSTIPEFYIKLSSSRPAFNVLDPGPVGQQLVRVIHAAKFGAGTVSLSLHSMDVSISAAHDMAAAEVATLGIIQEVIGTELEVRRRPVDPAKDRYVETLTAIFGDEELTKAFIAGPIGQWFEGLFAEAESGDEPDAFARTFDTDDYNLSIEVEDDGISGETAFWTADDGTGPSDPDEDRHPGKRPFAQGIHDELDEFVEELPTWVAAAEDHDDGVIECK